MTTITNPADAMRARVKTAIASYSKKKASRACSRCDGKLCGRDSDRYKIATPAKPAQRQPAEAADPLDSMVEVILTKLADYMEIFEMLPLTDYQSEEWRAALRRLLDKNSPEIIWQSIMTFHKAGLDLNDLCHPKSVV